MSDIELAAALQRIEQSRRRLHAELMPPPDDGLGAAHGSPLGGRWLDWLRTGPLHTWFDLAEPWLASGSLAVRRWWRRQPWHDTAVLLLETGNETLSPVIRRHPLAAVGIAAAAGAALVMVRPWQHPHAQRVANGGVRQARRWLVRQLANPVLHTVLASAFTSLAAAAAPPRRAAPSPAPATTSAAAAPVTAGAAATFGADPVAPQEASSSLAAQAQRVATAAAFETH